MEKGNAKTAIIILVILIILAGGFLGYKIVENKNKNVETANEQNEENNVLITGISKKEEKPIIELSGVRISCVICWIKDRERSFGRTKKRMMKNLEVLEEIKKQGKNLIGTKRDEFVKQNLSAFCDSRQSSLYSIGVR